MACGTRTMRPVQLEQMRTNVTRDVIVDLYPKNQVNYAMQANAAPVLYNNFWSNSTGEIPYIKSASFFASSALCPAMSFQNAIASAAIQAGDGVRYSAYNGGLLTLGSTSMSMMRAPMNSMGTSFSMPMNNTGASFSIQDVQRAPCFGRITTLDRMVEPGRSPNQQYAFNCQ